MDRSEQRTSAPVKADERQGGRYSHDQVVWQRVADVVAEHGRTIDEVVENFPLYARRLNLTRFLAHYELFRKVIDLPGSVVECGVFRGTGLMTWAKLLEIFCPGDRSRRVIGFDNFEGFRDLAAEDGGEAADVSRVEGGYNGGRFYDELVEHISIFHDDSFVPRAHRVELVHGDLRDTAPDYVEKNPGLRISILHLDVDVFDPTLAALKAFYPKIVRGGIVVMDEYALQQWPGESAAVEQYFDGKPPRIVRLPFSGIPGGYFVKD